MNTPCTATNIERPSPSPILRAPCLCTPTCSGAGGTHYLGKFRLIRSYLGTHFSDTFYRLFKMKMTGRTSIDALMLLQL